MNKYRTHTCNELNKSFNNKDVMLSGGVNKKRDHGNLLFIDLRDHYGVTQCVIEKGNSSFYEIEKIPLETVIKVLGKVIQRKKDSINSSFFQEFSSALNSSKINLSSVYKIGKVNALTSISIKFT